MTEQQKQPTMIEMKAAIYDRLAVIDKCQAEIKQINDQIVVVAKAEQEAKETTELTVVEDEKKENAKKG